MGALHAVALLNAEMQLNNHMNYINEENGTLIVCIRNGEGDVHTFIAMQATHQAKVRLRLTHPPQSVELIISFTDRVATRFYLCLMPFKYL